MSETRGDLVQINDHTEHRRLNEGDLVLTASGELRRVSRYRQFPDETWLDRWSSDYAAKLSDDELATVDGESADDLFPLTVVTVVLAPVHVITDEAEAAMQVDAAHSQTVTLELDDEVVPVRLTRATDGRLFLESWVPQLDSDVNYSYRAERIR